MKIQRSTAVTLLTGLGLKTADKLSDKRLLAKLAETVAKADDEDVAGVEDAAAKKLLKAIQKDADVLDGAEIVADGAKGGKAKKEEAPAKGKKGAKAKKEEAEEEDEEEDEEDEEEESDDEDESDDEEEDEDSDDEDEDEDESEDDEEDEDEESDDEDEDEEEEKPTKKKGGKKGAKDKKGAKKKEKKGPGVIETIATVLTEKATKEKPLSKDKILAHLVKAFPDHDESALKSTISQQVPTKLRSSRGLDIVKNEKGYYVKKGGKKAKKED